MHKQAAVLRAVNGETMVLQGVAARGQVSGLLFELTVEQRYRNATASNIEAVYTFPLPSAAVLLAFEVELDGKKLAGVVVEKSAAEQQYEDAVEKGDTAIMLERAGDGLCTVNLGNLMAGEEATIRYRHAQLLRFEHGSIRLAVPTVIAPRYGDPSEAGLQIHQQPVTDLGAAYPLTLTIDVQGDIAKGRIASPSHRISTVSSADGVTVSLVNAGWLDRDFVLAIDQLVARSFATVARDGDGYLALASFCADVPRDEAQKPLRLKVLVDCSGSMNGDSIEAARRALQRIFAGLDPVDQFTLSRFGTEVHHDIPALTAASPATVRAAAGHLSTMVADLSGTEIERALRSVFTLGGTDAAADVLLITDGEIWNADSLVEAARAAGQRVFTIGIGAAPAEGVLRRLAEASGGACEFVAPNEGAEAAIMRMFARLRSPRVEHADVTWPGTPTWVTTTPRGLFGGETIHVFAGFAAAPAGDVAMRLVPCGDSAPLVARATLPAALAAGNTLARMAGAKRIETADDATRLALALRYQLLTEGTNFIVVHERADGEKATDLPSLQKLAQMHAAGWGGVGSVGVAQNVALGAPMMNRSIEYVDKGVRFCRTDAHCFDEPTVPSGTGQVDLEPIAKALDRQFVRGGDVALPRSLADLGRLGVGESLLDALTALVVGNVTEDDVVRAFLEALGLAAKRGGVSRQLLRALRNQFNDAEECADLRALVATIVGALIGLDSPVW